MRTIVLGPPPAELAKLIEHRRAIGADLYDEVWEGEYHMAPAPHSAHGRLTTELAALLHPLAKSAAVYDSGPLNVGEPDDYRVPDLAVLRSALTATWHPTAAIVVEIVSPDDETWEKLPFYAAHGVDEVLIVDPRDRSTVWLGLIDATYEPLELSLLGITPSELAAQIDWPPAPDR